MTERNLVPSLTGQAGLPADGQHQPAGMHGCHLEGESLSVELCPESRFVNEISDQ